MRLLPITGWWKPAGIRYGAKLCHCHSMYCQQNTITMQPYPPVCWISRRSTEELCRGKSRRISALSRAGSLQPRDSRDRSRTNRHSCDGVINYTSFLVQWLNHTTTTGFTAIIQVNLPSVLWHCSLGGRKGIRPVRKLSGGCWRGYLSGARCRLAYGPADATATHCLLFQ